jgi:hypothetical protein
VTRRREIAARPVFASWAAANRRKRSSGDTPHVFTRPVWRDADRDPHHPVATTVVLIVMTPTRRPLALLLIGGPRPVSGGTWWLRARHRS